MQKQIKGPDGPTSTELSELSNLSSDIVAATGPAGFEQYLSSMKRIAEVMKVYQNRVDEIIVPIQKQLNFISKNFGYYKDSDKDKE